MRYEKEQRKNGTSTPYLLVASTSQLLVEKTPFRSGSDIILFYLKGRGLKAGGVLFLSNSQPALLGQHQYPHH